MRIDLSTVPDHFRVKTMDRGHETLHLVFTRMMGIRWTEQTRIFRSSVWNQDGEAVSLGFKKFFNWGENPDLVPLPRDLRGCEVMEKIDGNLLIVSRLGDDQLVRTRGTLRAQDVASATEVAELHRKYPAAFTHPLLRDHSLLFEYVSDGHVIILRYPDCPDMYLVGAVRHKDYSYLQQDELDALGKEIGVKRPRRYSFKSIDEMCTTVRDFDGVEGICLYLPSGQEILKVKGALYLALHSFKSNCSLEHVIDFYLESGRPNYQDLMANLTAKLDWECMQVIQPYASALYDGLQEVNRTIDHMKRFVESLHSLPRKDAAERIISSYGSTERAGIVFNLLSGKPVRNKEMKKMLLQMSREPKERRTNLLEL